MYTNILNYLLFNSIYFKCSLSYYMYPFQNISLLREKEIITILFKKTRDLENSCLYSLTTAHVQSNMIYLDFVVMNLCFKDSMYIFVFIKK